MRRTLENLWYGNITPQEKKIHRGTAYDDAVSAMCKNGDKLETLLEGKEKETFEKFCDAQDEVHDLENLEYFIEGFRLGARLIMESFDDSDGDLSNIDD